MASQENLFVGSRYRLFLTTSDKEVSDPDAFHFESGHQATETKGLAETTEAMRKWFNPPPGEGKSTDSYLRFSTILREVSSGAGEEPEELARVEVSVSRLDEYTLDKLSKGGFVASCNETATRIRNSIPRTVGSGAYTEITGDESGASQ